MKTYYIRTRKSEIVIDSDVTNGGFGPIDRENLEEIINAMLGGQEDTCRKLRRELKAMNEDYHYLTGMEKDGHIVLNIEPIDEGFDKPRPKPSQTKLRSKKPTTIKTEETGTFL